MQSQSKFFDDLSQLMTSALGAAHGMRQEAEGLLKSRLETLMAGYDFVARDEFDAVREMAIRAREENERLQAQLEKLQDHFDQDHLESVKPNLTALNNSDTAFVRTSGGDSDAHQAAGYHLHATVRSGRPMVSRGRHVTHGVARKGSYRSAGRPPKKKRY